MCGIIAYLTNSKKNPYRKEDFQKILDKMNHRGPDAQGIYLDDKIILGHKRLSIIDLSEAGNQPLYSRDGNYIIIYNGEIYNYLEIKKELKEKFEDIQFHTNTDTEILLLGYIKYGPKILKKVNGMFSFVIYDKNNSELFIARDRFGIKPLYYVKYNNELIFCSEIKPILKIIKNYTFNKKLIFDYIALNRVDHLDLTFFNEIRRFPAGYYLKIKLTNGLNRLKFIKWWDLNLEIKKLKNSIIFKERNLKEHIKYVKLLFENAIRLRLRSDVEVGSCLSGGIDSSSIVSIASRILKNSNVLFKTYSVIYGKWFELDESKYVQNILNHFQNVEGKTKIPTIDDVNRNFKKFIYHQEEPVPSFSPYTQYEVMKLAKSYNQKVLLDGQGGDEILAGYRYMSGYYLAELFKKRKWKEFLIELFIQLKINNFEATKTFLYQFLPIVLKNYLLYRNLKYFSKTFLHLFIDKNTFNFGYSKLYNSKDLNEALIAHVKYKLQHLLRWEDKNAMAFSIENRTPFLDHNLVVYLLSLKSSCKIYRGINKWIFRQALKNEVPKLNLFRTDKIGFAAPDKYWIYHNDNKLIKDLFDNPHPYLYQIFNIQKILTKNKIKKNTNLIFKLICLNTWFKLFFK